LLSLYSTLDNYMFPIVFGCMKKDLSLKVVSAFSFFFN
jgi:hypothetical protein